MVESGLSVLRLTFERISLRNRPSLFPPSGTFYLPPPPPQKGAEATKPLELTFRKTPSCNIGKVGDSAMLLYGFPGRRGRLRINERK